MHKKDTMYSLPQDRIQPFEFNEQVAAVFDDMIGRSVPMYRETVKRQAQLAARFYQPGTRIYDLGCSNGNLGLSLCSLMPDASLEMVCVDTSRPMLDRFAERLAPLPGATNIRLVHDDIRTVELNNASVVVLNLTLQFVPTKERDTLIKRIHDGLVPGGVLLLTEKVIHDDPVLDEMEVGFYYRLKEENGYSRMEISGKREALENVLVPEPLTRHQERLHNAGFTAQDIWLKWFNFASFIARRGEQE
ncbi:MAG TPA: carboxy-S-adenosyl-L-methionine synthase CmoA [Desulfomicrobiaceae bacterium]|nr:carboxy-S-adenosyl-L-methionine synthase CmoA [Desulfomicrobiaceae bacterium]